MCGETTIRAHPAGSVLKVRARGPYEAKPGPEIRREMRSYRRSVQPAGQPGLSAAAGCPEARGARRRPAALSRSKRDDADPAAPVLYGHWDFWHRPGADTDGRGANAGQ